MHVTTNSHILTLGEDHVYSLRKIGVAGDDSWLESRRGEAFGRHLKVQLHDTTLELFFERKSIGSVLLSNNSAVNKVLSLVEHWNREIGPTDLSTIKTVEMLRIWPQLLCHKRFNVKCVTYNCGGLLAEMALKRDTWVKLLGSEKETSEHDVIVLSFQETDSLNRVKNSILTLQRVCDLSRAYLFKTHALLSSVQLLGLMTIVFVKHKLVPHVSHLSTSTSSTGLLRMWGNKGAVLTKFKLFSDEIIGNGHEFVFVNCHLSAGEGVTQLGRRKWELKEIGNKFGVGNLAPNQENDESSSISDISEEEIDPDIDSLSLGPKLDKVRSSSQTSESTAVAFSETASEGASESDFGATPEANNGAVFSPTLPATNAPGGVESPTIAPSDASNVDTKDVPSGDLPNRASTPNEGSEKEIHTEIPTMPPSGDTAEIPEIELSTAPPSGKKVESRQGSRYIAIMGDLNYRVLLSDSQSKQKVNNKEWDGLLAYDSLLLERRQGLVFLNFEEPRITFAPTYKYELGTRKLKGRIPSYTDRVLYRSNCPTEVIKYDSIPDLLQSDHRPVTLTGAVESDVCVSSEAKDQVTQRSMVIADTAENNARPKLEIDQPIITLSGPPLSVVRDTIVVKKKGSRPVHFIVENAQAEAEKAKSNSGAETEEESDHHHSSSSSSSSSDSESESVSTVTQTDDQNASGTQANGTQTSETQNGETQTSGTKSSEKENSRAQKNSNDTGIGAWELKIPPLDFIRADAAIITPEKDITISPASALVNAKIPEQKLLIEARVGLTPRDVILLVKPKPTNDHSQPDGADVSVQKYVFVRIEPTKSVLGQSLDDLPHTENNVPVPIYTLGEYLRAKSRTIPRVFLVKAESSLFQQVLSWIDNGQQLDMQVLNAANTAVTHAGDYAVAQVLLSIFEYLPEQFLGPNAKRKMANKKFKETITYICQVLNDVFNTESTEEVKTLDLWANVLYDRRDCKAGPNEKRAYLRSMLIMASSQ